MMYVYYNNYDVCILYDVLAGVTRCHGRLIMVWMTNLMARLRLIWYRCWQAVIKAGPKFNTIKAWPGDIDVEILNIEFTIVRC